MLRRRVPAEYRSTCGHSGGRYTSSFRVQGFLRHWKTAPSVTTDLTGWSMGHRQSPILPLRRSHWRKSFVTSSCAVERGLGVVGNECGRHRHDRVHRMSTWVDTSTTSTGLEWLPLFYKRSQVFEKNQIKSMSHNRWNRVVLNIWGGQDEITLFFVWELEEGTTKVHQSQLDNSCLILVSTPVVQNQLNF